VKIGRSGRCVPGGGYHVGADRGVTAGEGEAGLHDGHRVRYSIQYDG
jgi:hypothetical protein